MQRSKYQINFMPESWTGFCSTACFMGILNYFRYTQFNMKDTRDVMKIAKMGTYKHGCGLDEADIAYALSKFGFTVDFFSGYTQEEFDEYEKNPIPFIYAHTPEKYKKYLKEGKRVDGNTNQTTIDLSDITIFEKIKKEPNIQFHYHQDIKEIIKKNQADNVMFLLGLNRYVLFNEPEYEGESGGHVVLCRGIKDGKMEIYDPGPNPKVQYIDADRVVAAMNEMGAYVFVMIKDNRS